MDQFTNFGFSILGSSTEYLTCRASSTLAYLPSQKLNSSKLITHKRYLDVVGSLTDDGWPQSAFNARPQADLVHETDFQILNPQSHAIAQVDLWIIHKPSFNSLFACNICESHILTIFVHLKNDILFTFLFIGSCAPGTWAYRWRCGDGAFSRLRRPL